MLLIQVDDIAFQLRLLVPILTHSLMKINYAKDTA